MEIAPVFGIAAWAVAGGLFLTATWAAVGECHRTCPRAIAGSLLAALAFPLAVAAIWKLGRGELPMLGLVCTLIVAPSLITALLLGCLGGLSGPGAAALFAGMACAIFVTAAAATVPDAQLAQPSRSLLHTAIGISTLLWLGVYVPLVIGWGRRVTPGGNPDD